MFNEATKQWDECSETDANWYNYQASTGWNDDKQSRWANSLNTDGSYFVWIPRFAYRITYYESSTSTVPTGFYDGDGMWKAEDGAVKYKMDEGIETVEHNGFHYIVHPAFMKDTEKVSSTGAALEDYGRGGWSSNLTGFWIAKFSMSQEIDGIPPNTSSTSCYLTTNAGNTSEKNIKDVSKPNTFNAHAANASTAYSNSFYYDREKESHLMKTTEYGAMTYLTHSQYGRNGSSVRVNSYDKTGFGPDLEDEYAQHNFRKATEEQYHYGSIGVLASSTGTVYGVFDLNWRAREFCSSWGEKSRGKFSDENCKVLTGSNEAVNGSPYAVKEHNRAKTGNFVNIYDFGKIGDASKETTNYGGTDWRRK